MLHILNLHRTKTIASFTHCRFENIKTNSHQCTFVYSDQKMFKHIVMVTGKHSDYNRGGQTLNFHTAKQCKKMCAGLCVWPCVRVFQMLLLLKIQSRATPNRAPVLLISECRSREVYYDEEPVPHCTISHVQSVYSRSAVAGHSVPSADGPLGDDRRMCSLHHRSSSAQLS